MTLFSSIPKQLLNRVQWSEDVNRSAELLGMVWRNDRDLALEIEPHLPWSEVEHAIRIGAGIGRPDFRLIEAVLARSDCTLNLPVERLRRVYPYAFATRGTREYDTPLAVGLRAHMDSLILRINAGAWPASPTGHWPRPPMLERIVVGLRKADHGWALNQGVVEQLRVYSVAKAEQLNRRVNDLLDGKVKRDF